MITLRFRVQTQDSRCRQRHTLRETMLCQIESPDGGYICPAKVLNVSVRGIGLLVTELFERDTRLSLTITSANELLLSEELCVVRHVRQRAMGGYILGCEFDKRLSPGAVRRLYR